MNPKSDVYRGWTITEDENRPVTGRWRAEKQGVGMGHTTREGLIRMIDSRADDPRLNVK